MRQVAVFTVVNLAAIAAATLILHEPDLRDTVERVGREHQELRLQNARIERMLAAALNQHPANEVSKPQAAIRAPQASAAPATSTTAPDNYSTQRAARDELLQAGNALVDLRISSGVARMSDFDELAKATRGLSAAERVQIMARLSAAMNANQVRLEHSVKSP